MRALSESRFLRFLTFGALYLAQGLPWGFISVGYVVYLTDLGLSNEDIGWAVGLGYVPWTFKIVWGPLIDRFPSLRFGRRRPYIIASELLMGFTILGLMVLDPRTQLTLIGVVLFLNNTFASLQDVAVDALAVDLLPEDERGTANSIMWAGKSAGVAMGGGAGTVLAKYLGWPALFTLMAVLVWAIMLLPVFLRERSQDQEATSNPSKLELGELWRSFNFKAPIMGILVSIFTPFGYALIGTFTTTLQRKHLQYSEEQIGFLAGVVDPISGVVGALAGGILADKLGLRKGIGLYMAGIALTIGCFGAMPQFWTWFPFMVGWTIALNLFINAYNAATLGYFMSLSNPTVGATQFAVYMAGTNLCYTITSPLGGWMADNLGHQLSYGISAIIQALMIGLLFFADPREAEKRFRIYQPGGEMVK